MGDEMSLQCLETEIRKVMSILAINRMPTSQEIRMLEMGRLESEIFETGGYLQWAERLGLETKKDYSGIKKKDIPKLILKVVDAIGESRMPSRSEIVANLECGEALHNKICRNDGYRHWAEVLKLELKESETKLGQDFEDIAIDLLREKGFDVERMTTKYPFDLLVNNGVRVDVKVGRAYDLRGSRCHAFGINKKYASCDIYLIMALSEDSDIERIFIIPSNKLRVVTLSVGENSKYNKYLNRWDYIDQFDKFYKSIS